MTETMKIKRVVSVSYTDDPSCLSVTIVFEGETEECTHYLRDDDEYGNSPILRQWIAVNNPTILPYVPPKHEPEPEAVIVIPAVTFWERTTETEGTAIEAILNQQSFRVRQIFMTAQSYRSDHELWPLLQSAAIELFGEERAAQLLEIS